MLMSYKTGVPAGASEGILYLLAASLSWASYSMGLKRAGLKPMTVTIILSDMSFFILLGIVFLGFAPSNLGSFSMEESLPFILVQGVGVGVLATILFSYAISQLGSFRPAIIGALSSGLTALLAFFIFDEPLTITIVVGIALTVTGVILSHRS